MYNSIIDTIRGIETEQIEEHSGFEDVFATQRKIAAELPTTLEGALCVMMILSERIDQLDEHSWVTHDLQHMAANLLQFTRSYLHKDPVNDSTACQAEASMV